VRKRYSGLRTVYQNAVRLSTGSSRSGALDAARKELFFFGWICDKTWEIIPAKTEVAGHKTLDEDDDGNPAGFRITGDHPAVCSGGRLEGLLFSGGENNITGGMFGESPVGYLTKEYRATGTEDESCPFRVLHIPVISVQTMTADDGRITVEGTTYYMTPRLVSGQAKYNIDDSAAMSDLLNRCATEYGLNIVFFFGHDHSRGETEFFLERGDELISTVSYAERSSDSFTLNFYYGHAGYLSNSIGASDRHYTLLTWDDQSIHRELLQVHDAVTDSQ